MTKPEPIDKDAVMIESFSEKGVWYEVNVKDGVCTCPAFLYQPTKMCKHLKSLKNKSKNGLSISLLKSNLQKAIRKNNVDIALKTAKTLMNEDIIQFCRRFPIIILEDVILHPHFKKVIDILAKVSKKDGKADKSDMDFLLGIVADVAKFQWRENLINEEEWVNVNEESEEAEEWAKDNNWVKDNIEGINKLPEKELDLVGSINYRSKMGGMTGDMRVLRRYANLWAFRFIKNKKRWSYKTLEAGWTFHKIKYDDVKEIKKNEILLAAVDFHCSPLLRILLKKENVKALSKKHYPTRDVESVIKGIIWRLRSGVSLKREIKTQRARDWYDYMVLFKGCDKYKDMRIFDELKTEIDNISRWYISKQ